MLTVLRQNKEIFLDKISKLLTAGNRESLNLGLTLLCKTFTKEEIIEGLVDTHKIMRKDAEDKEGPWIAAVTRNKYKSPFGLKAYGAIQLKVICREFTIYLGYGPYIIYEDKKHEVYEAFKEGSYNVYNGTILDLR